MIGNLKFTITYRRVFFIAVFFGAHFYEKITASGFYQGHSTAAIGRTCTDTTKKAKKESLRHMRLPRGLAPEY